MGIFSVHRCLAGGIRPRLHLATLPFVFDVELASLSKDPTFSVGVVSWLIKGAMNLAGPVENFV